MSIELYRIYVARTLRPVHFDAVTPEQLEIPFPVSVKVTDPHGVNQNEPRNLFFVQYDESTHIGIAYVCSSLNHEPSEKLNRWVAITPTPKSDQSPAITITHPPSHLPQPVFINFAFKYKIRVRESIPSGKMAPDVYPVGTTIRDPSAFPLKVPATPCRIPGRSIRLLEDLHRWFWLERKTKTEHPLMLSVPTRTTGEDFEPERGMDRGHDNGGEYGDGERNAGGKDVSGGLKVGNSQSPTSIDIDDFIIESPTDSDFLKILHTRLSNQKGGIWSSARRGRGTRPPIVCSEDWSDDSEESETEEVEVMESNELKERTKQLEKWVEMSPIDVMIVH
ncbi:hypothetical protein BC832DRAFT_622074 [Gaertneriomyces semiglobifer]|nr:hypothetical protein BC832DRAFT_622074 [Gaertneriomyces semiglobifer]